MSLQCKKGILAFGMNRMNSKAAVFPSLAKRNAARGMKLSCTNFAFQVHSGNTSWKAPRGLPGSGLLPGKGTIAIVMVTWWPSSTAFQNPLGMCASDIFWLHAMSESKHFHQGSAFETWSCILLHKCSPIVFLLFFLWFWEVALCLLDTIIHIYIYT